MTKHSPVDVVFTMDTTGSMYPCLTQLRQRAEQVAKRLFKEVPDLRLGIVAHGDYCDEGRPYVTKALDLTADLNVAVKFIQHVEPTGGGDSPECYELVLHQARQLSWRAGAIKVLAMVGDDVPHEKHYPQNKLKLDWRNELDLLLEAGIYVYGVHALASCRHHSKHFYEEIAKRTRGIYLQLEQFAHIGDAVMAICYKQSSNERVVLFEQELQAKGTMPYTQVRIFDSLLDRPLTPAPVGSYEHGRGYVAREMPKRGPGGAKVNDIAEGLVPVPPARFQVLHVDAKTAIDKFATANGLRFQKGRGFYEFEKAVDVQDYKEVILLMDDGRFFSGKEARKMVGLPEVGTKSLTQKDVADAKAKGVKTLFIQSTSQNRALLPDTDFLYELEDWDVASKAV